MPTESSMSVLGRVRLYGRLGSRHSGLSGAEGLLTATLLTDTEQWTNGSKGRIPAAKTGIFINPLLLADGS